MRLLSFTLLGILAVNAFAGSARVTEDESTALSMAEAVAMACGRSGALRAEAEGFATADGLRMYADGLASPRLEIRLRHSRSDGNAGGGESSARLAAVWPLYQGGKVSTWRDASDHAGELASLRVRAARESIVRETRAAYCKLLLSEAFTSVNNVQAEIAGEFLENARDRFERKLVNEQEVLRAEVELANRKADLLLARTRMRERRIELLRLAGMPTAMNVHLVDNLAAVRDALPVPDTSPGDAATNRAEVLESELDARTRLYSIEALRADRRPEITFEASVVGETDWNGYNEDDRQLLLKLELPFLDEWESRGAIAQEEARQRQDQHLADDLKRDVTARLEVARAQLSMAEKRAEHMETTIKRAEEFLLGERQRLELGSATYLDVLNARRSLAQAQRDYYQALFDIAEAHVELSPVADDEGH